MNTLDDQNPYRYYISKPNNGGIATRGTDFAPSTNASNSRGNNRSNVKGGYSVGRGPQPAGSQLNAYLDSQGAMNQSMSPEKRITQLSQGTSNFMHLRQKINRTGKSLDRIKADGFMK